MGDRQCEDLVLDSIDFLDEHFSENSVLVRASIASLYKWQKRYDTGRTFFHVLEKLLKHGYLYVFNMTDHPDYERYREVFQAYHGWCSVCRDPTKEQSGENPEIGFYVNPAEEWSAAHAEKSFRPDLRGGRLYCVAGSELWAAFVRDGKLTGPDAARPIDLPIQKVVAMISSKAAEKSAPYLVRVWLWRLSTDMGELGTEALAADPDIHVLRRVAKQMNVRSLREGDVDMNNIEFPEHWVGWQGYKHDDTVNWFLALDDV